MTPTGTLRRLGDVARGRVTLDEPLAPYTTFRIGGPADALFDPADREDLVTVARFLLQEGIAFFALGAGSNLLFSDRGFRGVVIRPKPGLTRLSFQGAGMLAESGVMLPRAVKEAAARGLAGLTGTAGVPGTVGGALVMNAGTRLGELGDHLDWAEVLDRQGTETRLSRADLGLSYRSSALQTGGAIVLAAHFTLVPGDAAALQRQVAELLRRRKATQPLTEPNAGCVWRNPPGDSAGRLIEAAGLKGLSFGGARVSERHANFVVNVGEASAADVRGLMEQVHQIVEERFGISLEPEVRLVGDWG